MTDRRVVLLSAAASLVLLAGLLALAMPDIYEGRVIFSIDADHTIRTLDVVGLLLLAAGGSMVWLAGLMWQRRMSQ